MTTNNETQVRYTHRLTPEMYKALEAEMRKGIVTTTTTPIEAGFLLGIQHALTHIRNGWIIGE